MKVGNYSVSVSSNEYYPVETEDGYVLMNHNTPYFLTVTNNNNVRCNVSVEIDGKSQGQWRLNPGQTGFIDHPVNDQGRFTFYRKDSSEGRTVGLDTVSRDNLGLVQVTFTPERKVNLMGDTYRSVSKGLERESMTRGMSAGGTGLSGQSDQQYGKADSMVTDISKQVVISLRLVEAPNDDPRPLTDVRSNKVPPSVE